MTESAKKVRVIVEAVARELGSDLRRYAALRLRSPQDADDVVQEAFLRVLKARQIDIRTPPHYVRQVICRVIQDIWRKEQKGLFVSLDAEELAKAACEGDRHAPSPERQVMAECEVHEHLRRLDAAHREVWLLNRRDGFTARQIAKQRDMPVWLVKRFLVDSDKKVRLNPRTERGSER